MNYSVIFFEIKETSKCSYGNALHLINLANFVNIYVELTPSGTFSGGRKIPGATLENLLILQL